MNIAMLLDIVDGLVPDKVVAQDSTGSLTIRELREQASTLGTRLQHVESSGPVAFLDVNSTTLPIALFGSAYAGRVFAPLNYRADRSLMRHYIDVLNPAVIIAGPRYAETLPAGIPIWTTCHLADAEPEAGLTESGAGSLAIQIFTSGTTAAPKPARLFHSNLLAYVLGSTETIGDPNGATLVAAPNYHIATIIAILTSVYAARRIVFVERFEADSWLATAEAESITHAFVVPTMLQRIVDALRAGAPTPSSLRSVAYGGAPASRRTVEDALSLFGDTVGFVNAYGLTETSSTVALLGPDEHREAVRATDPEIRARLSSVGRPLPGVEVSISADDEILVRGAQVNGTYDNPPDQASEWFHTGDRGRLDAAGYLFVEGRLDDMIIRGGENISPVEVEEALRESSEVADAAVVGVSDREWGQRVEAVVELREPVDTAVLSERLISRLPSFKRPDRIVVVDRLPRTDLGKLQRRKVRAWLEEQLEIATGKDL